MFSVSIQVPFTHVRPKLLPTAVESSPPGTRAEAVCVLHPVGFRYLALGPSRAVCDSQPPELLCVPHIFYVWR
jgi:hypothetical protein